MIAARCEKGQRAVSQGEIQFSWRESGLKKKLFRAFVQGRSGNQGKSIATVRSHED